MWLIIILFVSSVYIFISFRKYLLNILLRLEFIVLRLFLLLLFYLVNFEVELYILMMFLVFSVCEGALGLSILVSIIRTYGNNYFQSFNILLC